MGSCSIFSLCFAKHLVCNYFGHSVDQGTNLPEREREEEARTLVLGLLGPDRGMLCPGPDPDKRSPARAAGSACEGS